MIILYLIEDYKDLYPDLRSGALSERILSDIMVREGVDDPHILKTDKGKPYERDNKIRFSLSHSGGLLACAVSHHEIGLDIETKVPKDPMALAKRFFTPDEVEFLQGAYRPVETCDCSGDTGHPGSTGLDTAFRRIWTRKEALLKYLGSSLDEIIESESVMDRDDVKFMDLDLPGATIGCLCIPRGQDEDVEICSLGAGEP